MIFNELFRGGVASTCAPAGDCNGDGRVDGSDAIYNIVFKFQNGSPPPAPFPECEAASEDDDCTKAASSCAA